MSTSPAPLPSAPPAPEWDGHVAVAAAQAVVRQSEQPAAAAVAVAVAEVVPSFPNDKRNDTIPLPPATMAHYAQPLPLPVHDDDVVNNNEHKEEEEHNRIVEHFTIDGSPGKHGSQPGQAPPGRQSSDNGPSMHGQHGGNAAPGLRGDDGGIVDVSVSMANASETGKIIVEGSVQKNAGGAQPPPLTTTHFAPVTTDFNVSARGGNGGRGGRGGHGGSGAAGSKGRNATSSSHGQDGGNGGYGGNAGTGADGGGGGTGGTITIRISDPDSYYLMAFPCCHRDASLNLAVSGGDPGLKGTHGRPGMPGQGGRGGHSYTWTTTEGSGDNQRTVRCHNPGGQSGPKGKWGMAVTQPLYNGNRGDDGKLTIHVDDSHQYDCRYDLLLSTASIQTPQQLQEHRHVFQFTDSIQITNMTCQNVGGMISPIQGSNIHFKVQQLQEELTIIPNLKTMGWFHMRLAPDEIGSIQGKLSFHVKPPNIRTLGYDMEPYRVKEKLYLAATQLGPYGFRRTYPNFHADGIMMDFRFPVENWTKLEGLPNICAGEGTHVKFCVTNTSLRDLGMQSRDGRKLVVQFYKNSHEDYDVESCHIDLRVEGVECSMSDDNGVGLWRGTSFEIDYLAAGQTKTFEGTLKLSPQVTPYSRLGVQAEILLEELGHNDNDLNEANLPVLKMMPVQRRQLEVLSEPTYMPFKENHVVLVSCAATRKDQFNAWSDLLTQRLGLGVEYYSVSIYGSLNPTFRPPNGSMDLAQAFKGKLGVVLDDTFNPLGKSVSEMEPSRMLPSGSQPQTSGYDKSTRWLLAGSTDDAVKQALVSHFTVPPNDATNFSSLSEFKKIMEENLKKERKGGCVLDERICEFAFSVKDERCWMNPYEKSIDRKAKDVKSFLQKMDPLRQYIIEPQGELTKDDDGVSYQQLVVRRGYCRTANRTHVLKMAIPPKENDGNAILAVVGALPLDTLILVFAKAVSAKDELVIEVALDIFTQHLLWEVSNVLEGRLNVRKTEDLNAVFPTLTAISLSSDLKQISGGTGNDGIKALSKLLARLECIANSQDLKPGPLPMSLRRAVRKTLLKMVAALKKEWVGIISEEDRLKEIQMIRNNVLDHLRKTYGILAFPRVKKASRWRKGLLHICSYRNKDKYEDAGFCGPAVRLCEMETLEYTITSCRAMRQQADRQKKMASQLLKSIEETRDELGLGDGGEIEVRLPHNTS